MTHIVKKTSFLLLICLNILIAFSLISCKGDDAKVVSKIPDGFVSLIELNNHEDKNIRIILWDNQISFMIEAPDTQSGEVCLYQTFIGERDVIVKYKDEYYVNEAKYLELTNIAILAIEERQRIYNFGDEVAIRVVGETIYTVKIISLETGETEPHYDDTLTTYYIKYVISPDVAKNDHARIISSVETEYGVSYTSLDFLDEETVSVKIRARGNDKIKEIILRSPDYIGLTYRVAVGE